MDYSREHTEQRIISLCRGYGGIEAGVRLAGVNVREVAISEVEAFCVQNVVAKMEAGALEPCPIWTDLKTFPAKSFHGKVHGITGGYPCQPFSTAGQRKGTEDPRHLWPHILRIVKEVRPIWCFFENVEGHLTMGYGEVYRSLRDLGYKVEAGVFSSSEVGAPHQRKRLFILAQVGGSGYEELADTLSQRSREGFWKGQRKLIDEDGPNWPAPPGNFQYEWEEPRTLTREEEAQSRLLRTANGISTRTDVLRAIGNGVNPWQAKKAWEVLWEKMNESKDHNP